jgi:hypothetical protein
MNRAALADADEAGVKLERDSRAERETARLDGRDLRYFLRGEWGRDGPYYAAKEGTVGKQAEDVRVTIDPAEPGEELVSELVHGSILG